MKQVLWNRFIWIDSFLIDTELVLVGKLQYKTYHMSVSTLKIWRNPLLRFLSMIQMFYVQTKTIILLGVGHHIFPFTLFLGPNLPSSFEGQYGNVRYHIQVNSNHHWFRFFPWISKGFLVIIIRFIDLLVTNRRG